MIVMRAISTLDLGANSTVTFQRTERLPRKYLIPLRFFYGLWRIHTSALDVTGGCEFSHPFFRENHEELKNSFLQTFDHNLCKLTSSKYHLQ